MKKSQRFLIKKPAVTLGFVECQDLPLFLWTQQLWSNSGF